MEKLALMFSGILVVGMGISFYPKESGNGNVYQLSDHVTQWAIADTVPAKKSTQKPSGTAPATANDVEKGKALVQGSDCFACHREAEKLVGPSYADVAKKYKPQSQTITMLANKVIAGGKGVWGEIPMTPHPAVSLADAKEMIKYVLSVKSK